MAVNEKYFEQIYFNDDNHIGFDTDGKNKRWIFVTADHDGYGIRIDKHDGGTTPLLSIMQARKLALKLLSFCDRLEHKDYKTGG